LNKNLSRDFSEELANHICSSHTFDCSILSIIDWAKENISRFLNGSDKGSSPSPPPLAPKRRGLKFARIFVYSHHIYSVKKRSSIVSWAGELSLDGFCMPGKPGCVCIEGEYENTQEYITRLRSLSWQKMKIKDIQTVELSDEAAAGMKDLKKFDSFEEKLFSAHANDNNIDLGLFFVFLKEKGLEHIFSMYFGVDGKLPSSPVVN
jgi:hypothetical protein